VLLSSADGQFAGRDFYSVAAHEIGHALGFTDSKNAYTVRVPGGRVRDIHHTAQPNDLMGPVLPAGHRYLISSYDIARTTAGRKLSASAIAAPRTMFAVVATDGMPFVRVSWMALPQANPVVNLYRSTTPGASHSVAGATLLLSAAPGQTQYDDTSAVQDQTYYYFVTVQTSDGSWEGQDSGTAISPLAAAAKFAVQVSDSGTAKKVDWPLMPGATSYDVYRSTTNGGTRAASGAKLFGSAASPAGLPTDGTLQSGVGYYYWVVAKFDTGMTYDYPVPGRGYTIRPDEPTTATASVNDAVLSVTLNRLEYDSLNGASHYDIYRSTTYAPTRQAAGAQLVGTISGADDAQRRFYDFTAPHDVNVYYWVEVVYQPFDDVTVTRALAPVGGSRPYTDWLDFQPVGSVRATQGTSNTKVDVTWGAVAGAGGYDIFVAADDAQTEPVKPSTPAAHVSDPSRTSVTVDSSLLPGDFYTPAGPTQGQMYRVWVVATPGVGLAAPVDVGYDRGYANGKVVASDGFPQGVNLTIGTNNFGYGFLLFRVPATAGTSFKNDAMEFIGGIGNTYLDTTAKPGVQYNYFVFHAYVSSLSFPIFGFDSGYRV
jgi:hypothetical protein